MARRTTPDNPRYPHTVVITRVVETSDEENVTPWNCTDEEIELYNGVGRVFTDTTTTGNKEMDLNRRKCSIPVRFDEWTMEILDGDRIEVTVGNISYSGVVNDIEPDNNRTLIYWERQRVIG